ncbi:MAG: hypothetical protein J6386_08000 [Candidatus Synoicihabitans palmerolidicus]|nr:hypothetical protein [Candidatus Synoicihabitans palmerolidicus]
MTLLILSSTARWHVAFVIAPTGWNLLCVLITICTQIAVVGMMIDHFGIRGAAYAAGISAVVGGVLTSWLIPAFRPLARPQILGFLWPFAPDVGAPSTAYSLSEFIKRTATARNAWVSNTRCRPL